MNENSTIEKSSPDGSRQPVTIKDLHTENPRWCVGCGDFGIVMALKRFLVEKQLAPAETVNVSGIGCSGRAPNYFNTYGAHTIHGRAPAVALGLALARPELNIFVHSGDGDALSIGGNHLLHAFNKNFNCVFLMYDNELYALTKSQTSPTTRQGHITNTQPQGTYLPPISAVRFALGAGASFVASTADWMPDHFAKVLRAAFDHRGFSFIHISQRCPHFDPKNFQHKETAWFSFLAHEQGVAPDQRIADKTEIIQHDPSDLQAAFRYAVSDRPHFGLFYRDPAKPCYDDILIQQTKNAEKKDRGRILDRYKF